MRLVNSLWIESRIALRFLGDNPMQMLLIVTGIGVGAAVIVFITALITGLQANIIDRTLGSQPHIRFEAPDAYNRVAQAPPETLALISETHRPQRLQSIINWQQVLAVLDQQPELLAVSPTVTGPALARRGVARSSVVLVGIEPERYLEIVRVDENMVAGRFRTGAGETVIGSELARALGLTVGDKLIVDAGFGGEKNLQVVGIFSLGVRDADERFVYVGLKETQALLDLPGGVTIIDARVTDLFRANAIAARLHALTGLKAESWMETNAELLNALRSQSMSTQMIRIFVGVSVAFGIASVLAVSVVQRTREIGILRAMGSRRSQILRVFLLQGGMLGMLGSLAGSAAGYGLVQIFNIFGPKLFYIPVDPWLGPTAIALATVTGVLAAALPARRAAHLDPAVAIRYV
ncbi:ABC transporter permease [Marinobacter subterrani]|uniref:ABC transporter permease n=1 Tax=Marinobacter subterrani TaxID=1658765 RepID=UPI002352D244|nr:FtsX-like permease family protein [Marinobacter subterrani]